MEFIDNNHLTAKSLNRVEKPLIQAEFSKNAELYDSVAVVQRRIADRVVTHAWQSLQGLFPSVFLNAEETKEDNAGTKTLSKTLALALSDQSAAYLPIQLLDAGAGTGYVGARLMQASFLEQSHLLNLTALDLSEEMLQAAQKREVYRTLRQGDIEALPFEDDSFDLVVSSLAIQWCHHPAKAIAELVRVTKKTLEPLVSFALDVKSTTQSPRIIVSTLLAGTLQELSNAFKTIDNEQHILEFITKAALTEIVAEYGGTLTVYQEVVTFDSLKALFKSLKNIGATALPNRRKGLLGRESYQQLDNYFKTLGRYQLTYVVGLIEIP